MIGFLTLYSIDSKPLTGQKSFMTLDSIDSKPLRGQL